MSEMAAEVLEGIAAVLRAGARHNREFIFNADRQEDSAMYEKMAEEAEQQAATIRRIDNS